jgi:hypothetical protein
MHNSLKLSAAIGIPMLAIAFASSAQASSVRSVNFRQDNPIIVNVANNTNHTIDFSGSSIDVARIDFKTPDEFQKSFSIEPIANQSAVVVSGVVGGSSSQAVYAVRTDENGVNHYQEIILRKVLTPFNVTAIADTQQPTAKVEKADIVAYQKSYEQIVEDPEVPPELKSRLADLKRLLKPGSDIADVTKEAGISEPAYRQLVTMQFN